jgi:hypothetical protein
MKRRSLILGVIAASLVCGAAKCAPLVPTGPLDPSWSFAAGCGDGLTHAIGNTLQASVCWGTDGRFTGNVDFSGSSCGTNPPSISHPVPRFGSGSDGYVEQLQWSATCYNGGSVVTITQVVRTSSADFGNPVTFEGCTDTSNGITGGPPSHCLDYPNGYFPTWDRWSYNNPPPPPAPPACTEVKSGASLKGSSANDGRSQCLMRGDSLTSNDGFVSLDFQQSDGNLVLYNASGPLWAPGGSYPNIMKSAYEAIMQWDGNFVIYDKNGNALFNSRTDGASHANWALSVNDNATVTLIDTNFHIQWNPLPGGPAPACNSAFLPNAAMAPGQCLLPSDPAFNPNTELVSHLNNNHLVLQTSGNLVLYKADGSAPWATTSGPMPTVEAVIDSNGALVLYPKSGNPLWSSADSGGKGGVVLTVNDNGTIVLYGPGLSVVWSRP